MGTTHHTARTRTPDRHRDLEPLLSIILTRPHLADPVLLATIETIAHNRGHEATAARAAAALRYANGGQRHV
jgi:hypothetical protein